MQKDVAYRKLKIRGGNTIDCDFNDYKTLKELFRKKLRKIYQKVITKKLQEIR